jgi:hypothetical protein
MNEEPQLPPAPRAVISWPLLLALSGVILGTACLMARNTIYTEGEVMEGFYRLSIGVVAAMLLLGLFNRNLTAWMILVCGGALILWQANQTRRWGMLHEDVLGIVAHANHERAEKGAYPATLEGYQFQHPEFRDYIGYTMQEGKLYIGYHLNDPGISYWYREDSGFGYYPD